MCRGTLGFLLFSMVNFFYSGKERHLFANTLIITQEDDCLLDTTDLLEMVDVRVLYCTPETFEHDYRVTQDLTVSNVNMWRSTKYGEPALLRDLCLQLNGLPVTRQCLRDEQTGNAIWADIGDWKRITCLKNTQYNIISNELLALSNAIDDGAESHVNALRTMSNLFSSENVELLPADVFLSADIMKRSLLSNRTDATTAVAVGDVLGIVNAVMGMPSKSLFISAKLNATNDLLSTLETYMDGLSEHLVPTSSCSLAEDTYNATDKLSDRIGVLNFRNIGVYGYDSANLSNFFVNPSCSNITGISLHNNAGTDRYKSAHGFWFRFLYANETTETLLANDTEVASYLPQSLWDHVHYEYMQKYRKPPLLVFKVYANDKLFIEPGNVTSSKSFSKVLSITIPGYESQLLEPLRFVFRRPTSEATSDQNNSCGYWNYETWQINDLNTEEAQNGLVVCSTPHLTSFSLLLGGVYTQAELDYEELIKPLNRRILDIVSLIGCSFSMLGLFGIFLTAVLFKEWRRLSSSMILINFSVALCLEMVLFVFVNTESVSEALIFRGKYGLCRFIGTALQYTILVHFCWMFILALLQFQRYVTIIGVQRPKHYIKKSAVLAWGLPFVPTLLGCWLDPNAYVPTQAELLTHTRVCYPSGHALTFGVIAPVAIISSANLIIFINIFRNIRNMLAQAPQQLEHKLITKQIRLAILLFFLLGLTWIFGIFAYMGAGLLFSYLFSITATLQGFVMFVFFVLVDKRPRDAWGSLLSELHSSSSTPNRNFRSLTQSPSVNQSTITEKICSEPHLVSFQSVNDFE